MKSGRRGSWSSRRNPCRSASAAARTKATPFASPIFPSDSGRRHPRPAARRGQPLRCVVHTDASDYAICLASLYAGLTAAGSPPDDHGVATATAELAPHGWTLDRDDDGTWFAEEVHEVERDKGPI